MAVNKPLRRQVTALRELKTKHADKASTWPILLGNNFLCLLAVDAYQTIAEDFADLIHPFRFNQAQQAAITRLRALPGGVGIIQGAPGTRKTYGQCDHPSCFSLQQLSY